MTVKRLPFFLAAVTAFVIAALTQPALAMYHPTVGRFLQRDPSGYTDGMSLYEYVGSRPLTKVDSQGMKVEIGQIASPDTVSQRVLKVESSIKHDYRYIEWWYVANAATLAQLGDEFSPGIFSKGSNAFVFTCSAGWLDLGHFFLCGHIAYAEGSVGKGVEAGIAMERLQDWIRENVPFGGGGFGASAWTPEDIVSDTVGALFGAEIQRMDRNIIKGYWAAEQYRSPPPSLTNITWAFKELLAAYGAVSHERPEVLPILQQDARSWQTAKGDPKESIRRYGKSYAASIQFQQSGIAFRCLCNEDGTARKEYRWEP